MTTAHALAAAPHKRRGRPPRAGLEVAREAAQGEDKPIAEPSRRPAGLSDAQREQHVKQALTRFVRNKTLPEELEALRYNLIVARVMSGMTAVEAAQRFGYSNSTQLSLIESGERKTPNDWKFLAQASRVYAVSTDFLLGLSPHMEFDAKVAQQRAMMRGTEEILGGIAAGFATAMIQYTNQTQPVPEDFARVSEAVDRAESALNVMRERHGFDDLPASAPLLSAIEGLSKAAEPIRRKLKQFRAIDSYFGELRSGRLPAIPYLTERYSERDMRRALLTEADDSENA